MKYIIKRITVILCVTVLLGMNGCAPFSVLEQFDKKVIDSKEDLYNEVKAALENGQKEISFVTKNLEEEDFKQVNQEHEGYYGNVTEYQIQNVKILKRAYVTLKCEISDNYYVEEAIRNGEEIPQENTKAVELKEICEQVLQEIDSDKTDYRKEKAIHDYLVKNVQYGYPGNDTGKDSDAYTAYGALVKGVAVCNGYAEAMKLLCDLCDVPCEMISGQADGEDHAWNLVWLDKEWYHVDVTWDDPEPDDASRILYTFFNLKDEWMTPHHTWEADDYPKAEGTTYNYYYLNELYCKDFNAFREKCREIFENDSPEKLQILVGDYDQSLYSESNLQFMFDYSGADYLSMQTAGKIPYTTLYFKLNYE